MLSSGKKLGAVILTISILSFSPGAYGFQDEKGEETSKKESCEEEITRLNADEGVEMDEKAFAKAVKKCEKKRKRANRPKCQPTGSRLKRC